VCSNVLQCVAVCCSVLQCVVACGSVLQCGYVCCSEVCVSEKDACSLDLLPPGVGARACSTAVSLRSSALPLSLCALVLYRCLLLALALTYSLTHTHTLVCLTHSFAVSCSRWSSQTRAHILFHTHTHHTCVSHNLLQSLARAVLTY